MFYILLTQSTEIFSVYCEAETQFLNFYFMKFFLQKFFWLSDCYKSTSECLYVREDIYSPVLEISKLAVS
jgi:hypothetical protein